MPLSRSLGRQAKAFGFHTGQCANAQLKTLLKLKNNHDLFRDVKTNIRRLVSKYLDVRDFACDQQEALKVVGAEIKKEYPDIFATEESEKRIYFALRVACSLHNVRRHQKRCRQRRMEKGLQCRKIKNQESPRGTPELASVSDSESSNVEIAECHQELVPLARARANEHPMNTLPDTTPNPSASCTMPYRIQHRAVYDFLEAAMPPMTHLMDSFIDFGCVNGDFLMAMSSWPLERIRYVLDQFGRDGRKMTEMEKFILQNHLKEYFT